MSRYRGRTADFRYGENQYKHFRNGKLIKPEDDPYMHNPRRKSFFADNPNLEDVAKGVSSESFDDGEYEELLTKYAEGGTYSSRGQAMESRQHVQNVKDKINSMKKKFQSLALVCDYVEGMEKYEEALETDPDSKMVKDLTQKLENLRDAPKIHTNEHSYVSGSGPGSAGPKQYGVSLADKRRQKALATQQSSSSLASSRSQSRAASPCRGVGVGGGVGGAPTASSMRGRDSSPAGAARCPRHLQAPPPQQLHAPHGASPHRFLTAPPPRSRTTSACRAETRDASTQVGRSRISSDSDDEKHRDSGISTHDEEGLSSHEDSEGKAKNKKKIDNRLKRELLKPKFFLDESGNLVRASTSDDSLADAAALPPPPPPLATTTTTAAKTASTTAAATTAAASTLPLPSPLPKIYYDFVSSSCRALFLFLKLAAVDFDPHPVQLRVGEQFQPEFEKLSPARRLPVLDDGGFVLREAAAICRYLADKNRLGHRWRYGGQGEGKNASAIQNHDDDDAGNDDDDVFRQREGLSSGDNSDRKNDDSDVDVIKSKAQTDEYLCWHQCHLRPACLQLFSQATLTPILTGASSPDFRRLAALKAELDNHCRYLENVFLREKPFIGGNQIGLADLFAVCELMQPYAAGFDVRQSSFRRLRQWMERVKRETRPAFDEAHAQIIKIWETKGRYIIEDFDRFVDGCC